jgi:hypothetical protein
MTQDARRIPTAHLDERPVLDAMALRSRGICDEVIPLVLQGATCISERELHECMILLEHDRRKKDRQEKGKT